MIDRVRHSRQIRLVEIGEAGQERIAASTPLLGGNGDARAIEARYLRHAGAMLSDDGTTRPIDLAFLELRHSAARDVGEGALRALVALREALGMTS
jgi:hypothetical protein